MADENTAPDSDWQSFIEIDPDPAPSAPVAPALPAWVTDALAAIARATDRASLERAIIPVRLQPEGPHKALVRDAMTARHAAIRALATTATVAATVANAAPIAATAALVLVGTFARRPGGRGWGIRVLAQGNHGATYAPPAGSVQSGARVTVTRKNGASAVVRVDSVLATDTGGSVLCSFVEDGAATDTAAEDTGERAPVVVAPVVAPVTPAPAPTVVQPIPVLRNADPAPVAIATSVTTGERAALSAVEQAARNAGPVDLLPTVHTPTGPSIFDRPRGERNLVVGASRTDDTKIPSLTRGDLIAGAAAHGHGVLLGWSGLGEMQHATLAATLKKAGFPVEWAPAVHSAHAQLGRATMDLNGSGYVVRAERGRITNRTRTYRARWFVGAVSTRIEANTDAFGTRVLTVTLGNDDRPYFDGDATLAASVLATFDHAIASEVHSAADITQWLRNTLVRHFRAVRLGGNWYVPRGHAHAAEQLCKAVSEVWGTDWMIPALPIATSDQLTQGLADSISRECAEIMVDFEAQRTKAREAKRVELGHRAAATVQERLKGTLARLVAYQDLIGERHVTRVREQIQAAMAVIEPLLDDTSTRFALIYDELTRDVPRE